MLVNHGDATFTIERGERIAQAVLAPVAQAALVEASTTRATARGAGGFGSTGIFSAKKNASGKTAKSRGAAKPKRKKAAKAPPRSYPRRPVAASVRRR